MDTINIENGNYIIPKSYFKDSLNYITRLEISIVGEEYGLMNPKLLKNSSVKYKYVFEKNIDAN